MIDPLRTEPGVQTLSKSEPAARRKAGRAASAKPAAAPIQPPSSQIEEFPGSELLGGGLPKPIRKVALLIETSGAFGRGLLRGVAKYNRAHAGWSIYFHPHGLDDPPPPWLISWRGDGIMARVATRELSDWLLQCGMPVVNLRGAGGDVPFHNVVADAFETGQLAAKHLLERCLRNFAFCGKQPGVHRAMDYRSIGFTRVINDAGFHCHQFSAPLDAGQESWDLLQNRLADWIRGLPKPIGIMACNDERGLQVLDACRRCEVSVPDDVAVIGADNDEHLCDLAIPPLTSIDVNAERVGYIGASLLDQLMQGRKLAIKMHKIPPRAVVPRLSTDTVASDDEEVNRAIRYIREHACGGLRVAGVLSFMGISRASLQQRLKKITGRTIHREIEYVRLNRVKELLLSQEMTIKQVARAAGFSSVQYMTRVFRVAVGQTPARFRGSHAR